MVAHSSHFIRSTLYTLTGLSPWPSTLRAWRRRVFERILKAIHVLAAGKPRGRGPRSSVLSRSVWSLPTVHYHSVASCQGQVVSSSRMRDFVASRFDLAESRCVQRGSSIRGASKGQSKHLVIAMRCRPRAMHFRDTHVRAM